MSRSRLVGVDAARGLALVGMMAVHVLPLRDTDGSATTAYALAGGRSAAAFAVLAGVGLGLATRHRDRTGAWAGLAVRAALIAALGLWLSTLDSGVAVILVYYGMLFLLAIPLLELGPLALGCVAAVAGIVVPVLSYDIRAGMAPDAGTGATTFEALADDPSRLLTDLLLTGTYPALAWVAYLAAGMAVGRLALSSARVATGLLGGGLVLAGLGWILSWVFLDLAGGREHLAASLGIQSGPLLDQLLARSQHGTTPTTTWWWLAVASPHASTTPDLMHTTGTALAVLGAALLVARRAPKALVPLAAAGGMTLTLYTLHVTALSTPYLPEDRENSFALQVVLAVLFAMVWRAWLARGPLESVVSYVSGRARAVVRAGPDRPPSRPSDDVDAVPPRGDPSPR